MFLGVFVIIGLMGNLMVCLAIRIDPKLQNATNYYLFSLAITDLLVSVVVIPLALVRNAYESWPLGNFICATWIFFDVFLCTSSVLLLCAISCERFIGIQNPLKHREKSKARTRLVIVALFILAIMLSSPILIMAYFNMEGFINKKICILHDRNFRIYGSILCLLIPLLIVITMYALTVYRLLKVLREFREKEKKHGFAFRKTKRTCSLASVNNNNILAVAAKPDSTIKAVAGLNSKLRANNNWASLMSGLKNVPGASGAAAEAGAEGETRPMLKKNDTVEDKPELNNKPDLDEPVVNVDNKTTKQSSGLERFKSVVNQQRLVNKAVFAFKIKRESTAVETEKKAVKVLGIVFVVFFVAWGPFTFVNIFSALFQDFEYSVLLNVLTWLGYISSSINPMVYSAVNSRFRYAFKEILHFRLKDLKKQPHQNANTNKLAAKMVVADNSPSVSPRMPRKQLSSNGIANAPSMNTFNQTAFKKSSQFLALNP